MVYDDKTGDWERVQHVILRYQKKDTLQYLFGNYTNLNDYPREIRSPYVCYIPDNQSGVLGVHVGQSKIPPLTGETILNQLEMRDSQDMESDNVYYLPLYRYQICDSVIHFHRMTPEEQAIDTIQTFSTIYSKGKYLFFSSNLHTINLQDVDSDIIIVYRQIYDVKYKYLIRSDTILQNKMGLYYCDGLVADIPMFYLPLETDVYYKKNRREYLVKKRLGFCQDEPWENRLDDYSHEIDTTLLALPIRVFQERYLQTKELFCLDEVSILLHY
jgi:hypothetical protein